MGITGVYIGVCCNEAVLLILSKQFSLLPSYIPQMPHVDLPSHPPCPELSQLLQIHLSAHKATLLKGYYVLSAFNGYILGVKQIEADWDSSILQNELDILYDWARNWQMEFTVRNVVF